MAATGSSLFASIWAKLGGAREAEILAAAGSRPAFWPSWTRITVATPETAGGHVLTYYAAADGITIGSSSDFRRVPVSMRTAAELATRNGWTLPTARMVDQIHAAATPRAQLAMPSYAEAREATGTYQAAHDAIEKQVAASGAKRGELLSGHKKDLVLSSRLPAGTKQIYGGRQVAGPSSPIWQGLSYPPAHDLDYVDYSEQYRPIRRDAELDGRPVDLHAILSDPALAGLISGETPATIDAGAILLGIGSMPAAGSSSSGSSDPAPSVVRSSSSSLAMRAARALGVLGSVGILGAIAAYLSARFPVTR